MDPDRYSSNRRGEAKTILLVFLLGALCSLAHAVPGAFEPAFQPGEFSEDLAGVQVYAFADVDSQEVDSDDSFGESEEPEGSVAGGVSTIKIAQYEYENAQTRGKRPCKPCVKVVRIIEKHLQNKSEKDIRNSLKQVCHLMPSALRLACKPIVVLLGHKIYIHMIQSGASSEEICQKIHLCRRQVAPLSVPGPLCASCESNVQVLFRNLGNPSTQKQINEFAAKAFHFLPMELRKTSEYLIMRYGPEIENYISKFHGGPNLVCRTVGVCPSLV